MLHFTQADKNWTTEDRKKLPGFGESRFHCDISMPGSEFRVNNTQHSVMVWGIFSRHTLGPLI